MRISPAQAALLTARERQLLETQGPYEVKQLATLIRRTRELRDKQRDLAQRQRVAATTRNQSKASAVVARTLKKQQLFERALLHYEGQLEKINRECASAMSELRLGGNARGATTRGRAAPAKKAAVKKTTATAGAAPRKATATKKTNRQARVATRAQARVQAAFR